MKMPMKYLKRMKYASVLHFAVSSTSPGKYPQITPSPSARRVSFTVQTSPPPLYHLTLPPQLQNLNLTASASKP
ncbi:hypothetical protein RRG08_044770 [Elysia crispata]|uniref:Uncharacterized protein n=1 Tax=Elysia crispata TaxID=231223 RepID=A0AAE1DH42_9GAST|nr:hypothetical protein RRG08_044770 [Elysia crispata]